MARSRRGLWWGLWPRALLLGAVIVLTTAAPAAAQQQYDTYFDAVSPYGMGEVLGGSVFDGQQGYPAVARVDQNGNITSSNIFTSHPGSFVADVLGVAGVGVAGLVNSGTAQYRFLRMNPSLQQTCISNPITGVGEQLAFLSPHVYVVGSTAPTGNSDAAVWRFNISCQPVPGDGFGTTGRRTYNVSTGLDIFRAGFATANSVVMGGNTAADIYLAEINAAGNDTGLNTQTIDPGTTPVVIESLNLAPNSQGQLDRLLGAGRSGQSGFLFTRLLDGTTVPTGLCNQNTTGFFTTPVAAGFQKVIVDNVPTTAGSFLGGNILGGTPFQFTGVVNFADPNLCLGTAVELNDRFGYPFSQLTDLESIGGEGRAVGFYQANGNDQSFKNGFLQNLQNSSFGEHTYDLTPPSQTTTQVPAAAGAVQSAGQAGLPFVFIQEVQLSATRWGDYSATTLDTDGRSLFWNARGLGGAGDRTNVRFIWQSRVFTVQSAGTAQRRRRRARRVVLARRTVTLRGGQRRRVRAPLTRAGRRLIRRLRRRRLAATGRARVRFTSAAGRVQSLNFSQRVTIRIRRSRRGR